MRFATLPSSISDGLIQQADPIGNVGFKFIQPLHHILRSLVCVVALTVIRNKFSGLADLILQIRRSSASFSASLPDDASVQELFPSERNWSAATFASWVN